MKYFALFLLIGLSSVSNAAVPAPPSNVCIDNICPSGIKWHPGHYMLVYQGDSQSVILNQRVPEICKEDALKGLQYRIMWADVETSKGTYNFAELDDIYSALAACGKRLVVQVQAVKFNTTNSSGIVPDYVLADPAYNGGIATTATGFIARVWEAPVMDRLIALYKALAARYDNKQFFEGIVVAETAISGAENAGYSASAWITQLKRAIPMVVAAWPNTNVIVFNNFLPGSTTDQKVDFVKFLLVNRVALGGPDVLPPPHSSSQGELIYRGEIGGVDMRGKMPAAFAVQMPELGGKEGTFTPKELYTHCVATNQCGHIFWIRNTSAGGSAQMWDTGILPFLRQNPTTDDTCPTSYSGCVK